jgi:hypothetical protein
MSETTPVAASTDASALPDPAASNPPAAPLDTPAQDAPARDAPALDRVRPTDASADDALAEMASEMASMHDALADTLSETSPEDRIVVQPPSPELTPIEQLVNAGAPTQPPSDINPGTPSAEPATDQTASTGGVPPVSLPASADQQMVRDWDTSVVDVHRTVAVPDHVTESLARRFVSPTSRDASEAFASRPAGDEAVVPPMVRYTDA